MKQTALYGRCEYCDTVLLEHDISKEAYEQERISLGLYSSVLLPKKVAGRNSHSATIDGLYCGVDCLIKKLEKILKRRIG